MSDLAELFRRNLRARLREFGAQSELARAVGMKPQAISAYLHPDGPVPGLDQLEKIASALGVTPADLISTAPRERPADHDLAECARRVAMAAASISKKKK